MTHSQIEAAVKRVFIAHYTTVHLSRMEPEQFVTVLENIFRRKRKVFENLAKWAEGQIARGHEPERVVKSLGFYAYVLPEYVDKNLNQPARKP